MSSMAPQAHNGLSKIFLEYRCSHRELHSQSCVVDLSQAFTSKEKNGWVSNVTIKMTFKYHFAR